MSREPPPRRPYRPFMAASAGFLQISEAHAMHTALTAEGFALRPKALVRSAVSFFRVRLVWWHSARQQSATLTLRLRAAA